jgi:hypothetical protein
LELSLAFVAVGRLANRSKLKNIARPVRVFLDQLRNTDLFVFGR